MHCLHGSDTGQDPLFCVRATDMGSSYRFSCHDSLGFWSMLAGQSIQLIPGLTSKTGLLVVG